MTCVKRRIDASMLTMPQGHPDYRFVCQEMWRKIQEVHPALSEARRFVDWQKYRLGRLQSEMRRSLRNRRYKRKNNQRG